MKRTPEEIKNRLSNIGEAIGNIALDYITDLEKENAELKKQVEKHKWNDIFLEDCAVYDNKIAEEYTSLQEQILKLEKENAELKRVNRGIINCANCDEYVIGRCCNYPNGVCYHWKLSEKYKNDDVLTKAKEIIKTFLGFAESFGYSPSMDKFITEAEQFIKE